jgi:hypothetical protein
MKIYYAAVGWCVTIEKQLIVGTQIKGQVRKLWIEETLFQIL